MENRSIDELKAGTGKNSKKIFTYFFIALLLGYSRRHCNFPMGI